MGKEETDFEQPLTELYRFDEQSEVADYLSENSSLVPLLREAYPKIQEYFGPGTEVTLEVYRDHEAKRRRELLAQVQTRLGTSEALARLDRLYGEWWAEASAADPLKMSIDVEII